MSDKNALAARDCLSDELALPGGSPSFSISAVGQAHLDLAWLWPIRETIRKGARTFATALALMERYSDYVFGASQAQLYQWMKDSYPHLYERVRARVQEGRWELQGGMWVESDVNVTGGESLVRQLLYGLRFFREEFGIEPDIGWLPDDFGFPASLPQILVKSGLTRFTTIKLSWNTVNLFPRTTFWWKGVDGSRVLTHLPPEGTYNSSALPHALRAIEEKHLDKAWSPCAMLLFGIGDGGGGPGEEHLERLARERNLSGVAPVAQERARAFFDRLAEGAGELETWRGDLYLERHQGTFTSQARSKRYNRRLDTGLRELEWISALAALQCDYPYPVEDLERIWKEVLLYQFHDILPGSSIRRVYDESLTRYELLLTEVEALICRARDAVMAGLTTGESEQQFLVTNSLGWPRKEWAQQDGTWKLVSAPAMGYSRGALDNQPPLPQDVQAGWSTLETDLTRISFGASGTITSILDKTSGREVLEGAGNILTLYDDPGDAWDFPADYRRRGWIRLTPSRSTPSVDGPRAIMRQEYETAAGSSIVQEVILTSGSRRIDFVTKVQWKETHKMLRAEFPVTVRSDVATSGTQFGSVIQSTRRNTSWEVARDEICAHKFVDLSEAAFGVALLDDCKYGHRITNRSLDLNLLRSPTYPDPTADMSAHEFTYASLPHDGGMRDIAVTRAAYELNVPIRISAIAGGATDALLAEFSLVESDHASVIIETVKQAEDSSGLVVRAYEARGATIKTALRFGMDVVEAWRTDLMERPLEKLEVKGERAVPINFAPFEIQTVRVMTGSA